MNYKGNAFSAGSGDITSARQAGGKIYFLQELGSSYALRAFDPQAKSFATMDKTISFADMCFFDDSGGIIELFGTKFVSTKISQT